jgi:beta-N-acetylhexosaminidase
MEIIRISKSFLLGLVIVFIELASAAQDSIFIKGNIPVFMQDTSKWVDSVFNSLSPEEKIAQLIMIPAYPYKDTLHSNHIAEIVKKYDVGGVIFFKGGPYSTVMLLNLLQRYAKTPLLIGIDGEWGLAMRIDSTISYPRQMMLGALNDDTLIYKMACDISEQLHRAGFQTSFSPCVDINSTSLNPVISSRSFGSDKNHVTAKSEAYMYGLQDNRILGVIKHFPGHGDTENDSHLTLPVVRKTFQQLDTFELVPFKALINAGTSGVMVAHLDVPGVDSSNCPSTLSQKIISGLLKDSLGFKGLVFTDAINMKGIKIKGSPADVILKAFIAGNDILLMPDDVALTIKTLKTAADSSIISYDEIDRRCKKILKAKKWAGLDTFQQIDTVGLMKDLHKPAYEKLQRKLIESALTVLKNDNSILPLKRLDTLRIACLSIGWPDISIFQKTVSLYTNIDCYPIDKNAPDSIFSSLLMKLKNYNLVIAALVNTDMRLTRNFGIVDKNIEFLNELAGSTNVILNVFASPYVMQKFVTPEMFKAIILSYEDKPLNQDLSAQLIFGGITACGKLPVKASDNFQYAAGFTWNDRIRIKYTIPEELDICSDSLRKIDTLINEAIRMKALPGCVVYLAKEGKVFYNKAYGYFTYDSIRAVKTTDLYDLASITKIAATLPSIIYLNEKKKIDLDARMSAYVPKLKKTNKKKILVQEVLSHQARLQEWYPFYLKTIHCHDKNDHLLSKTPGSTTSFKVNGSQYINCETDYTDSIFSKCPTNEYTLKVADSLYLKKSWKDSIYNYIYQSDMYSKAKYRYSDFGFMLLSEAVENITSTSLDKYADSLFYKPLGASSLCFNPLNRYSKSEIAPTLNDSVFRKQIVQGYVHDPSAAMLGGVCGHAGLFGTANDLGKLMQLYLNLGKYGGQQYLSEKSINLFTSRMHAKSGNRRALGFDKPEPDTSKNSPASRMVSDLSYGHTGYTGTMVWIDPKFNLVYIFLSNRTFPYDRENKLAEINLRTMIQDVVYKAINRSN